ncbi:ABC transporter ATP-binding protein [Streptomyces roseoverticillatus]|uniref:ABC transporter ATP-binding protein n=1 Tax=Streptomyces roseoverticillatus TaxID=66429 RepID=A0ABV3J092_9ACTN
MGTPMGNAIDNAIDIVSLTKRYGRTVGVEDLDISVAEGEVFGFLGPNGAGKTTTMRCLVGLLRPTEGSVRVLGRDPVTEHLSLAPYLGYLPGELRLYPELTGRETLRLLATLQGAPAPRQDELCARLNLSGADLDRTVREYSRGMKQKLGLVQALQHEPELVVLDEPTEGLDPLVQETFYALLAELGRSGRTVLLSSHVLPEVQRTCRRVAIVRAGRLVTTATVAALREARARKVRLTFADGLGRRPLGAADRWSPDWHGDQAVLMIPPDRTVAALRELLALPVRDVTVEEAGLDEAFLDLYRGTAAGEPGKQGEPRELGDPADPGEATP